MKTVIPKYRNFDIPIIRNNGYMGLFIPNHGHKNQTGLWYTA